MRVEIKKTESNGKDFTLVTITFSDDSLKMIAGAIDKYLKKEVPIVQIMITNPQLHKTNPGVGVVILNHKEG